jgi:hypothetical protein
MAILALLISMIPFTYMVVNSEKTFREAEVKRIA